MGRCENNWPARGLNAVDLWRKTLHHFAIYLRDNGNTFFTIWHGCNLLWNCKWSQRITDHRLAVNYFVFNSKKQHYIYTFPWLDRFTCNYKAIHRCHVWSCFETAHRITLRPRSDGCSATKPTRMTRFFSSFMTSSPPRKLMVIDCR